MTFVKWGERNIICVCRSDIGLTVEDDSPDDTIESSDATCGDLNIEGEKKTNEINILGFSKCATDRVFFKSISLVKIGPMSTVGCKIELAERQKTKVQLTFEMVTKK